MSSANVYIDSCCFVDWLKRGQGVSLSADEEADCWFTDRIMDASRDKEVRVYTSLLTGVEVTKVRDDSGVDRLDKDVQEAIDALLWSGTSGVIPIQPSFFVARQARDLRWDHDITVKPPDALHIASAVFRGCDEFWTRDQRIGEENRRKIKQEYGLAVRRPSETVVLPDSYRQLRTDGE